MLIFRIACALAFVFALKSAAYAQGGQAPPPPGPPPALVKVADVVWRPQEKRLVIGLSRFDWLAAESTEPALRRCRSALRFDRVHSCKC